MSNDNESSMVLVVSGAGPADFLEKFEAAAKELGFYRPTATVRADYMPPSEDLSQVEVAPRRRHRRTNAEIAAEKLAAQAPVTEVAESLVDDESQTEAKTYAMDDAKDAGRLVIAKGNVDALRAILSKFAVAKVADLKPPQFEDFVTECEAVVRE